MKKEYQIANPAEFQVVIEDIFSWYQESGLETLVIALKGDLGAGKTTFTQELGRYLKIEEPVTSPTFTIMKQYEVTNYYFDKLVHIDAYRIESESEIGPLRLSEIINQTRTIVCVEWPEIITSVVPDSAVNVEIEIGDGENRAVRVSQKSS